MAATKTFQGTTNYTSLAKASARRANYTKKRPDHGDHGAHEACHSEALCAEESLY